jgi:hypothetical protein
VVQDEPIRDLAMRAKQAKRGGFICIHEARISGHIGAKDCREPSLHD